MTVLNDVRKLKNMINYSPANTVSGESVHQSVKSTTKQTSIESVHKSRMHLNFSVDRLLNTFGNQFHVSRDSIEQSAAPTKAALESLEKATLPVAEQHDTAGGRYTIGSKTQSRCAQCLLLPHLPFHGATMPILRPTPIKAFITSINKSAVNRNPAFAYFPINLSHTCRQPHHERQSSLLEELSLYGQLGETTTQLGSPLESYNLHNLKSATVESSTFASLTNTVTNSLVGRITPKFPNSRQNPANNGKRKRSWSRAVFSNLQRKGLEIQFQQQKYITKPDRRKLATRLNLTDAQVKIWFQNRRMKWRHTRENLRSEHVRKSTALSTQHFTAKEERSGNCGYLSEASFASEVGETEINVVE